ncbi:tape measure protein [Bacteroides fragilis]
MAGRLSFSIAINLLTENFKRGTNSVKNGLRVMQMQVLTFAAALGAGGLGLSNFVSRLIDVARETSRVTNALKNVSGSMAQLADNQRFLLDMAKKYGIEINALTGNYAKFTAAASISGMSMMDQRKIFESVSRAVTAFGMSAEDSNGVFLALSQMMSKGKVSSEELRLQMGERLPIALQAMAKAAGVSVGGLTSC